MNIIFFVLVAIAFASAAWHQLRWDGAGDAPMAQLSTGVIDAASGAVELAIALIGVMTLFLGLIKVAEAGGLLAILARLIRPLMVRLFPDVPPNHPAMGAMILNLSANMMGLGNAATPFGIRAMQALNQLNTRPGTASDSMVLFLAINTSSVTLLPTGVIAIRAAAGSSDPAAILPTTLFATLCATIAGISAAFLFRRFTPLPPAPVMPTTDRDGAGTPEDSTLPPQPDDTPDAPLPEDDQRAYPGWVSVLALLGFLGLIPLTVLYGQAIAPWIIPSLILGFLSFGLLRGVRIYEVFVEGAKDGFQVAVRIIPYLVAILVAVGMLRVSGALGAFVALLGPITGPLGLPAEALPMALLRPLSGSGAYGVMASIINDPDIGPDSYVGYLVSTLQGSTETTFYVLAVYFGAVGIRRLRHALPAALTADLVAIIAAVVAVGVVFGTL
ncbi:MAG TPA: nucleoside recognition domain-containing protein [Thioalkalivibrio sp.]|nr:nucleoside recognition domain-containing protein [Thioalkalivibrio sp.]